MSGPDVAAPVIDRGTPQGISISRVIDEYVESTRRPVSPRPAWYPSSLGGCDRKALLKRAGVEGIPLDMRAKRKMAMGDLIHGVLQRIVSDRLTGDQAAVLLGHELRVRDDDAHMSGRLDSLVYTADGLEVLEYKSIHSGAFQYNDLPKPDHMLQLGVYLTFPIQCYECLGEETPAETKEFPCVVCGGKGKIPPPNRGRLIYVSKDDLRLEEYVVTVSPELRANVRETLKRLDTYWETYQHDGTLPPVLELVQAERKTKDKDGRIVKEPFFYLRGAQAGKPKMAYNRLCKPEGASYSCEFFMQPGGCPVASWPIPDPEEEPAPKPAAKPRGKKKPEPEQQVLV